MGTAYLLPDVEDLNRYTALRVDISGYMILIYASV
jgi:hypothetical protein